MYTEETANLSWGFGVPIASLNSLSEDKSISKIYPKDLLEHSSFNNCVFECSSNGFGTHDIDQTDCIISSQEVIKNKVVGKGILVDNFLESNPCDNCKARGINYYCSLSEDCTSEISKIQNIRQLPVVKTGVTKLDLRHGQKWF